jgi:hypothetical protein
MIPLSLARRVAYRIFARDFGDLRYADPVEIVLENEYQLMLV